MLKLLSICAALIMSGTVSVSAQQREAVLQTIEVPGATFDIVLAVPKAPEATIDLGGSPEALVIYLIGGELALGFESWEQMLKAFDSLQSPVGTFHVKGNGSKLPIPVAVYIVAKGGTLVSAEK